MLRKLRSRLTYANVASTIALVLAVGGGTAYAATKIGTGNIRYHAVTALEARHQRRHPVEGQEQLAVGHRHPRQLDHDQRHPQRLAAGDRLRGQPAPGRPEGRPGRARPSSIFGVVTADGGLTNGKGVTAWPPGRPARTRPRSARTSASARSSRRCNGGGNGNVTATPTAGNADADHASRRASGDDRHSARVPLRRLLLRGNDDDIMIMSS